MKFSIIIPIYNTEKYLSRCIESILSQSIQDFELILVNDGSTDSSGRVCDIYVNQDDRIRVFHKTNEGVSVARNVGLEYAIGEWVVFIDSDDWVESNWLDVLTTNYNTEKVDLYAYGLRKLNDQQVLSIQKLPQLIINNVDFIKSTYYNFSGCAYLFKRSIIEKYNIKFPVGLRFSEDQDFLLKYISKCDNILLINEILYNYYIYSTSTVGQNISTFSWAESNLVVANDFLRFCKKNDVPETFYEYPVKRLYEAFFIYYYDLKKINVTEAHSRYLKEYKITINLYPEFKKQSTFLLASYHLSLPKLLKFRKIIKKFLFE